ncbi:MAG: DUF484 family protein [Candidatus Eiseniibacteriota bacterium]
MSEPSRARTPGPRPVTAEDVADFLARHPEFMSEHPDVLALIVPPSNMTGDNVADMQRFMIDRLRAEVTTLKTSHQELITTTRTNMSSQRRVHEAALELLTARTFEELIERATTDLAIRLDVDVVSLCVENDGSVAPKVTSRGVRLLKPGTVDQLMGEDQDVVLHAIVEASPALFGHAARSVKSEALMRLRVSPAAPAGVLALGSRNENHFDHGQGTELLDFLARVLETTIRLWLDLPG